MKGVAQYVLLITMNLVYAIELPDSAARRL